jgi:hypothetical protein
VPVLVTRDIGGGRREGEPPPEETWGENIIGNVGLSFAFGVASPVSSWFARAIGLAVQANLRTVIAALVLVGVVSFLLLATLQATMQGVYSAALYRHATHSGTQVPGFDPDLLQQAFKSKT